VDKYAYVSLTEVQFYGYFLKHISHKRFVEGRQDIDLSTLVYLVEAP